MGEFTPLEKQFEGTGNECDDKVVEWPKEGWTLSL